MRLDKYLWFARFAKTRATAQQIAEQGRLRIDGRRVDRAHVAVSIGQVLTFALAGRVRAVRVAALPARRGPVAEARACYTELNLDPVDSGEAPAICAALPGSPE